MDWTIAAAIAEVIGAIAVIISLIYLAIQIKAQTHEARLAGMHDISVGFRDLVADFGKPETAALYVRGLEGVDAFTDEELFQLITGAQRAFRLWEEAFYLHKEGRLDSENWDGMNRQLASFWSTEGFQYVWKIRQQYYGEDFVEMVNNLKNINYRIR